MDIISKSNNKKPPNNINSNNTVNNFLNIGNNTNYPNNNNEEEDIYLVLFVPELNLELEWRKADNEKVVLIKYDKNKNEHIDYKIDDSGCKNLELRAFDSLQVELNSVDSNPIDVKCKIVLMK